MLFKTALTAVTLICVLAASDFKAKNSINDGICDTKLLTGDVRELQKLSKCRVIDGSLTLTWMKDLRGFAVNNYSFPELVEIRDYLKVHQIDNIRALSVLFPNLAVIRGKRLYEKFSLRITENKDLEEVGLTSLRYIENGNVHIEKNAKLCFSNTINWSAIAPSSNPRLNKIEIPRSECATCSDFCWNLGTPQSSCNESCQTGFCSTNGACCDSQCVGGCLNDPSSCVRCKFFSHYGDCVANCPENTFAYKDMLCVSRLECAEENAYSTAIAGDILVPFDGVCRLNCPPSHKLLQLNTMKHLYTCFDDKKFMVCNESILISDDITLPQLSKFKDCQVIKGSLEIELSANKCNDHAFMFELKRLLTNIVEIHDFLKIINTPIRDLGFLSSLKIIRGISLESGLYSVVLKNNKNLKRVWLPKQNVVIDEGDSFIDLSPNLCTNCTGKSINVEIEAKSYVATFKWKLPKLFNESLIQHYRYHIWREDDYAGANFCASRPGVLVDATTAKTHVVYRLEPSKKYIYQLLAYDSKDEVIAESNPDNFQSADRIIKGITHSETESSITISWQQPNMHKENLVQYVLKAFHNPPNRRFYLSQNFCTMPINNMRKEMVFQNLTRDLNRADYEWIDEHIKKLLFKELANEVIKSKTIEKEFIIQTVDRETTKFTFNNMHNYAYYYISIRACYNKTDEYFCTDPTLELALTNRNFDADQIESLVAKPAEANAIELQWNNPANPNGVILSYTITLQLLDGESDPKTICLPYESSMNRSVKKVIRELTPGDYRVAVLLKSLPGAGSLSDFVDVTCEASYAPYWVLLILAVTSAILITLLLTQKRRIELLRTRNNLYYQTFVPSNLSDDGYELERENISLMQELGNGHFGQVHEGVLKSYGENGVDINVAVKTVNNEASFEDSANFLKEAAIMRNFNTFHIIKLLGFVSSSPPYLVVMELMSNGDLKTFLRKNRPLERTAIKSDNYTLFPLIQSIPPIKHMAIQIADGMAYISQKKFVHRDLASRNCMVAGDLTVKIGDFGLTRDVYESDYYRRGWKGLMPVRWMAPESLIDGIFTTKSDVFSFGVVLWEIVTFAEQPYRGLSNEEVVTCIADGRILTQPGENCPDDIYAMMLKCWQFRPDDRITFVEIIDELIAEAPPKFFEESFYCLRD